GDDVAQRRIGSEAGQLSASLNVGEYQGSEIIAIATGEYNIAHVWGKMVDEARAQRTNADPGSRRQLEILGNTPVEQEPLGRIVRIDNLQRVAELVETLFIEGVPRQLFLPPIARRDVRAAQPRFKLAFVRHELEIDPRRRQADIARSIEIP